MGPEDSLCRPEILLQEAAVEKAGLGMKEEATEVIIIIIIITGGDTVPIIRENAADTTTMATDRRVAGVDKSNPDADSP